MRIKILESINISDKSELFCLKLNTLTILAGAEELEPLEDQPLDPLDPPEPPPKKNADASRDSDSTQSAITTNTYLVYK